MFRFLVSATFTIFLLSDQDAMRGHSNAPILTKQDVLRAPLAHTQAIMLFRSPPPCISCLHSTLKKRRREGTTNRRLDRLLSFVSGTQLKSSSSSLLYSLSLSILSWPFLHMRHPPAEVYFSLSLTSIASSLATLELGLFRSRARAM